jgi:predicted lipid-binding transport protein (Tim44 family)
VNRFLLAVLSTTLSLGLFAGHADAKKLSSGGMQRSIPAQKAPNQAPAQTPSQAPAQSAAPQQAAAPAAAGTAAAAAAAPKRSWLGPVAGIAAGLGLAALASHLGFGAELANFMTMLLIGVVLMVVISFVMRRFAAGKAAQAPQGMQFAGAGPGMAQPLGGTGGMGGSATPAAPVNAPVAAPQQALSQDGFDAPAFEQIAKRVFIRLQAANDARDQDDLRRFTTPEMYAVIQQELLQRQGEQRTDVLQLQAQVVDRAEEDGRQIVSVRFNGLIREQSEAAAEPFDEVWHLVRPADGSREWAIAGIQALN